jgi:hypothetical protein
MAGIIARNLTGPCDMQSAFPVGPIVDLISGPLFLCWRGEQFVQAHFAAISGIAMDDAALGGLIDSRDQLVDFIRRWLRRDAGAAL